ncbi:MAG: hypothetical protein OES12_05600 [Anaerolineae bacterium]|nr:hypothetical protein [Anaerolineae bacterium]
MKPGKKDKKASILIAGQELAELQKHTWEMAESFGLDRRIDNYKGTRPISFYRWDMECLLDVLDMALNHPDEYPAKGTPEYEITEGLYKKLKRLDKATKW